MSRTSIRGIWLGLCLALSLFTSPALANTPDLFSPAPGSNFSDSSQVFEWSPGATLVEQWWLYVGTSPGSFDIYDSTSALGLDQSASVNIPINGQDVYVRLWFRTLADGWQFTDYIYSTDLVVNIVPTEPVPNSILNGEDVTFRWSDQGFSVEAWWLYVGSSEGANDFHDSGNLGLSVSERVTTLPADGSVVYARLWYFLDGVWQFTDSTYLSDPALPSPLITMPAEGTVINSSTQTFAWTDNGVAVDEWWLYVGSSEGARDYHDSGALFSSQTETVTGLPTDGRMIYVRLWHRESGQSWQTTDFVYMAGLQISGLVPTSPTAGAKLTGDSETFTWSAQGLPVTEWWLEAGSSVGRSDYYNSGSLGTHLSTVVTGLPENGSTVFVRFWYRIGGDWLFTDVTYRGACLDALPSIVSPAGNSTLGGDAVTFSWSANSSASTEWWFYAGTSLGGSDILDSAFLDGDTSIDVSGLPTDGSTVYVRLWHREAGGSWQFLDYTYAAANN